MYAAAVSLGKIAELVGRITKKEEKNTLDQKVVEIASPLLFSESTVKPAIPGKHFKNEYFKYYIGVGENHIEKFEQIEGILYENISAEAVMKKLQQKNFEGYLHLNNWKNDSKGLIANLRNGLDSLHAAVAQFGIKKTATTVQETSNPCFHGVMTTLQGLLLSNEKKFMLFTPNLDPNQMPIQRITELIRVYKNEKLAEVLKERSIDVNQENIDTLMGNEGFISTPQDIYEWCVRNEYVGIGSTRVNFSTNCSGILFDKQEISKMIAEVLSLL